MMISRLIILPICSFVVLVAVIVGFGFEFAWYYILPAIGLVFLLANWMIPFLWNKKVPLAARVLIKAYAEKLVPALIVHDSGRSAFHLLLERKGEGVVITDRGDYRLLPRYADVDVNVLLGLSKKKGDPKPSAEDIKAERLKLDWNTEWITKRSILIGLGLPFYVGYSGKLCLLNPECLAWYEAGELFVPTEDKPLPTTEKEKKLPMPLMLLNPAKMNHIINKRFDMSQLNAILVDSEDLGRLGRGLTTPMKIGLIILLGALAVGVIMLAPSLMQG